MEVIQLPRPKRKRIQAKDLPDRDVLALVLAISMGEKPRQYPDIPMRKGPTEWVFTSDLALHLSEHIPWKVVLAKLRALVKRKLLDGCACGCRGDFWVTPAGRALLEVS